MKILLALFLLAASSPAVAQTSDNTEPLRMACQYLWSQQAEDGGWHSEQYAVLRSGQALTPFVLHALLAVPESICARPKDGVGRALEFIRKHVDEEGALGHADPDILEYPVYSTAYAIQCLTAVQDDPSLTKENDRELISKLSSYLSMAQFDEAEGFDTTHAAYGGWGFDVAKGRGESGHMDLAHTRRAVQALRCVVPTARSSDFTRAELFLRVVQRDPGALAVPHGSSRYLYSADTVPFDGGFFFSPIVEDANKGRFSATLNGQAAPHFRSYATATCDGVLALLAAGVPRDDERVLRAAEWLRQHDDLTYPQGVPIDHPEPWGEAIRFYHYAVRSEAYAALRWPESWRSELALEVARHQALDGSFRNEASPLMKEDEPLLCTGLATIALTYCHSSSSER
ncbi:MAG: hypothetical protein WD229_10880 [Pirellulales bacterium]